MSQSSISYDSLDAIISKICHDIISPIGAVHNGMEVLEELGADAGPDVIDLVNYSAGQAGAKLSAFRIAYGGGGNDYGLKPEYAYNAIEAIVSADGKIVQNWDAQDPLGFAVERPEGMCKVLVCLLMLGMECLPKGGVLRVQSDQENAFTLTAEGDSATLRDDSANALENFSDQTSDTPSLSPHAVHAAMTAINCTRFGFSLTLETSDGQVKLTATHA